MNEELRFDIGDRFSIALLVFFITYFIFEIPSNVVLRKIGAANWLSFLCFSWGMVIFGAGFAKKWEVSLSWKFAGVRRDILIAVEAHCGLQTPTRSV